MLRSGVQVPQGPLSLTKKFDMIVFLTIFLLAMVSFFVCVFLYHKTGKSAYIIAESILTGLITGMGISSFLLIH